MLTPEAIATIKQALRARWEIELRCNTFRDIQSVEAFAGMGWDIPPKIEPGKRLTFFLMSPLAAVLLVGLAVFAAIDYCSNAIARFRRRKSIRRRVAGLPQLWIDAESDYLATLDGLWGEYGPPSSELDEPVRQQVLVSWLDILFGEGTAAKADVDRRLGEIAAHNAKANAPYYRGDSPVHFYFGSRLDQLVRRLSGELGPWVHRRSDA